MEKRKETNPVIFIVGVIVTGLVVLIVGTVLSLNWSSIAGSGEEGSSALNTATPATVDVSRLVSELGSMLGLNVSLGIEPINTWLFFIGSTVVVIGSVVAVGALLAFLFKLGSRMVTRTKESEEYQSAENELANRETAAIKQLSTDQPADPIPSHDRPVWSAISTIAIIVMFFVFAGITIAWNIDAEAANLVTWAVGSSLVGLIIGLLMISPKRIEAIDSKDAEPIPWGSVWVVISGLVILGMGLGVVLYVIT